MKAKYVVLLIPAFCSSLIYGQSTDSSAAAQKTKDPLKTAFARGIRVLAPDSSYTIKFGFRFQNLLSLEALSNDPAAIEAEMMVRRCRLKADGFVFSPDIEYKFELGISNRDMGNPVPQGNMAPGIVYDAVVKWRFAPNTELWFGQTKLPGNRERVISSQALQFVDRSRLNADYNLDRDVGLQLHHQFEVGNVVIRDIYALSIGEGRNITVTNRGGLDYTARLEMLPFGEFTKNGDYFSSDLYREKTPKLSVAATYDYNQGASNEQGQLGDFLNGTTDLRTVFADLMFKYRGFSVLAEYANKNSDQPVVYNNLGQPDGTFVVGKGYSVQGGYLFKNNWELAARYTHIDPVRNIGLDASWMYTLGISRYIVGHNLKFQSDISLTDVEFAGPHSLMFRFQTEVAF